MPDSDPPKNNSVALVEFYPYHSELIYSHLLFLRKNQCKTIFFCDVQNAGKLEYLKGYATIKTYDFRKFSSLVKLWFFLLNSKIEYVIFNTAQGSRMLKFSLFWFPKRIKMAGILHNTKKIETSFGQKIISLKLKNYFILTKYMYEFFPEKKGIRKEYINCSYVPSFEDINLKKSNDEIWVTIPGSIEKKRRDYDFLLKIAKHPNFPQYIRFILLGNASRFEGPRFLEEIQRNNLKNLFKWFEEYVPDKVFFNYMKNSDYLLPLIHPSTPSVGDYLKYKASGTFIQSCGYSIPMICHGIFNKPYFNFPSLFYYNEKDFLDILHELKAIDFEDGRQISNFEVDQKRYCNFLLNN